MHTEDDYKFIAILPPERLATALEKLKRLGSKGDFAVEVALNDSDAAPAIGSRPSWLKILSPSEFSKEHKEKKLDDTAIEY
jgi:hypothetical protein